MVLYAIVELEDCYMRTLTRPKIVQVLASFPDGATIDELAEVMKLTEKQVRGCIDRARIPDGWNIENVARRTFKLMDGTWRGA